MRTVSDPPSDPQSRALAWLATALAFGVIVSLGIAAGLAADGVSGEEVVEQVGGWRGVALAGNVHDDSWMPMSEAYTRKALDANADMYSIFFDEHIKFQYPPSSLLILDLMPRSLSDHMVHLARWQDRVHVVERWITWPSRLVFLLAIVASVALIEVGLRRLQPQAAVSRGQRVARVWCALALGFTFYPLLKSYELGQIQVFLNGIVALALLALLAGSPVASGVLIAVCCLIKPQYGVVVLAAIIGRHWRFAVGFGGACVLGLGVSVLRFGLHDHVRYLAVLQAIGRRGETYWPNQSVNGLLNRFLENGDPVNFVENDFAPYLPGVYTASVLSALVLLALALWPDLKPAGRLLDRTYTTTLTFALVIAAATMGSPVAWEHHYGTFLAIFALALPGLLVTEPWGRWTGPLFGLSYVAIANAMLRPELLFWNRYLGVLGSHLFFGSLILFALLWSARAKPRTAAATQSLRPDPQPDAAPASPA